MRMPRPFLALIGGRAVVSAAADGRLTWNASSPQRWAAPRIAALLGRSEIPSLAEVVTLRPATRVLIAGLSGCIVLVAFVTMAAVVSVEMSAASLPEWFRSPSSGSHGAVARLQATFDNIIQRPLFSRSRQGIPIALASAPAPPSQPSGLDQNITLKGVFISGGLAKAFLISPQNPTGVWVQSGGEIAGWRVVAVQPDQVQLNGQDEKLVLPLNVGGTK